MRNALLAAIRVTLVSLLLLSPLEVTFARRWSVAFVSLDAATRQKNSRDTLTRAWPPSFIRLGYSNSNEDLVEVVADATVATSRYDTPSLSLGMEIDIIMPHHRPMGCVIEESLASSQPDQHIVFVASVTEGGAAAQAGLLPGDVIVGLSNAFSPQQACLDTNITTTDAALPVVLTNVTGWAIDRVKSLIQCRADDTPFQLRVLRGTRALEEHEAALTELCSNPDLVSTEADQCLLDYIQGAYGTANFVEDVDTDIANVECAVNEDECLLDDLHNLWASDLPPVSSADVAVPSSTTAEARTNGALPSSAPKPWSSRASPSGTFVRDPATGRMKNLNENP